MGRHTINVSKSLFWYMIVDGLQSRASRHDKHQPLSLLLIPTKFTTGGEKKCDKFDYYLKHWESKPGSLES
jgi:hypothetical protein